MKRLRAALDDDADNPHFIETLPRHGYRLIGSVNGSGQDGDGIRAASVKDLMVVAIYLVCCRCVGSVGGFRPVVGVEDRPATAAPENPEAEVAH